MTPFLSPNFPLMYLKGVRTTLTYNSFSLYNFWHTKQCLRILFLPMRWSVRRGPFKKACLYATFDLQDLIACKFSHRWTCLYINICMSPNFLCSASTIMFPHKCVVYDVLKDGYLHIFWITKTWLLVTFNMSHRVLPLTFHWCAWNDVKPHDFKLTNPSQYATFEIRNHILEH